MPRLELHCNDQWLLWWGIDTLAGERVSVSMGGIIMFANPMGRVANEHRERCVCLMFGLRIFVNTVALNNEHHLFSRSTDAADMVRECSRAPAASL